MIYIVIIYLWVSLLLYILLGGADFGAGILELFTSRHNRRKTRTVAYRAIGPIWEANHMWLIIAIVILFVGFPVIYALMSVHLHLPLLMMLLGIIARGTALTFRNYDAVVDDMQKLYNRIFIYSSFITPFFLGVIAASTVAGSIDTQADSFLPAYVYSWCSLFTVATGFFTVAICGYLAAVYLIGEVQDVEEEKLRYIAKARSFSVAALGCGIFVFIAAWMEKVPLQEWLTGNTWSLLAVLAASVSMVYFHWHTIRKSPGMLRILAGFQVTMILFAITFPHFPDIILLNDGSTLSLLEHHGQEKAINMLGWALLLGSIFILPALFYLVYSFQKKTAKDLRHTH